MTTYIVNRRVTKKECFWLEHPVKKGTVVYAYRGATYGCIGSGKAICFEPGGPFTELPLDALSKTDICGYCHRNTKAPLFDGCMIENCPYGFTPCL